jgi:DNA repair and recombination RAD54-like protein
MGRIYRTGQKRRTTIFRLFSTGTLEEIIYQRQLQKGALASSTVDGREETTASFTPEELKECMTLKLNTVSDTKDKIGASWPDREESLSLLIESGEAQLETLRSEALSFIHIVDATECHTLRPPKESYAADDGATSEEDILDYILPGELNQPSQTNKTDNYNDSENEEFEF